MRTEATLETIHRETSRSLTGITQGLEALEVVRRNVSTLCMTAVATTVTQCLCQSPGRTADEFDRKVVALAQSTPSTSAPLLRTPDVITEELMTTAYIKLQINNIVMTLEKMTKSPAFTPSSVKKFQPSLILEHASMSITRLRHHVVQQVTGIRDLLDSESMQAIFICPGACALNKLAVGLETLHMGYEAILVGNWAIMLARSLRDGSAGEDPDASALLSIYLYNQSCRHIDNGDYDRGLQAIEEAFTISQDLRDRYWGEAHFQILHSDVLLQYAGLVDTARAIDMSVEAVQALEGVFNVQAFTQPNSPNKIQVIAQLNSSFFHVLFSWAPSTSSIMSYARALQRLGTYLFMDGHPNTALDLELLAVSLCRQIVSIYGNEYRVGLARALSSLVQGGTANLLPAAERINMADECIQIFREMAEKNPPIYARKLVDVLWVKARTLGRSGQHDQAISTWEEVASIAGLIIQDSKLYASALGQLSDQFRRLEKHEDAVRTGKLAITTYQHDTQAVRYLYLCEDLQRLRRYRESVDAARTSVALFRHLAMKDSAMWACCLTASLSDLAHCLAALGNYSEAVIAHKESVSILGNFVNRNPDAGSIRSIGVYVAVLDNHPLISLILEDEDECLNVCSTAIQYLCQLSKIYPQNADIILTLLWAETCHGYNMLRVGRLQDALQYIDNWVNVRSSKPEAISESGIAAWRAAMIILKADVLDPQGDTKQALLATQKAFEIVRSSISTYQPCFFEMINSMVRESRLRTELGQSNEALRVAEEALRLSRDNKLEPIANTLVLCLHGVAFSALSCHDYKRAIEAAREGCAIYTCREDLNSWQNSKEREKHIFIRPGLFAFMSFAEANLGRFSTALECAHRAVDISLDIGNMKLCISATTAEHSYMESRGNLADILLASDDLAQARQIYEERRVYFLKKVERRMGDYRDLAPILRVLGILRCHEGQHEGGQAAAAELSRMIRMLGSAFPSLQEQVKIRLRNQFNVPILKVLDGMSQKLGCKHQTEFDSLTTI